MDEATFWILNRNYSYVNSNTQPTNYIMYGNFALDENYVSSVILNINIDSEYRIVLDLNDNLRDKLKSSGGLLMYFFYLYLTTQDKFGIKLFDTSIDTHLFEQAKLGEILKHNRSYIHHCDKLGQAVISIVNEWILDQIGETKDEMIHVKDVLLAHLNNSLEEKGQELFEKLSGRLAQEYLMSVTGSIKTFIEDCLTESVMKFDMVNPEKVLDLERRLEVLESLILTKHNL